MGSLSIKIVCIFYIGYYVKKIQNIIIKSLVFKRRIGCTCSYCQLNYFFIKQTLCSKSCSLFLTSSNTTYKLLYAVSLVLSKNRVLNVINTSRFSQPLKIYTDYRLLKTFSRNILLEIMCSMFVCSDKTPIKLNIITNDIGSTI